VAAQSIEDVAEAVAETVEHSGPQDERERQKLPVRETRGLATSGE